jgi:hypothetical protein
MNGNQPLKKPVNVMSVEDAQDRLLETVSAEHAHAAPIGALAVAAQDPRGPVR